MTSPRRPLLRPALLAGLLACAPAPLPGQQAAPRQPPSPDSLAGITARGRALQEYDVAAWHASDSAYARRQPGDTVNAFVARKVADRWVVVFGRLTAARDTLYVRYEATQAGSPLDFRVVAYDRPEPRTGVERAMAAALDVTRAALGTPSRPYNPAVLPAPGGDWYVYWVPAQVREGVWPLGGDVRFLVSADGATIKGRRQLHNSILEVRPSEGTTYFFHSAVVDEQPEDTDVFHVLTRGLPISDLIVSDHFLYRIDPDGTIHFLGDRSELEKLTGGQGKTSP